MGPCLETIYDNFKHFKTAGHVLNTTVCCLHMHFDIRIYFGLRCLPDVFMYDNYLRPIIKECQFFVDSVDGHLELMQWCWVLNMRRADDGDFVGGCERGNMVGFHVVNCLFPKVWADGEEITDCDTRYNNIEYLAEGLFGDGVGGESLEGAKMGVCPRRPGLAWLGELRRLERRSTLGGSGSREQSRGEERSKNAQGVRD